MQRTNLFRLSILSAAIFIGNGLFAQNEQAVKQYIAEGVKLNNSQQYEQALEQFNQALLINPKHDQANYLMASTYYRLGRYSEAVLHSDKAINFSSAYDEEAYLLKGDALMKAMKYNEAIQNYNKMLTEYPEDYLAYYNMAKAHFQLNDVANAEYDLTEALTLNPTHAESHLLLGNIMISQGEGLKAVLALTNFLLIEPYGPRAVDVYAKIRKQMPDAFGDLSNLSSISLATEASTNQFASSDVMLSIMNGEKTKAVDGDVLAHNTQELLDKLTAVKKESTFWWNFYVNFYNDMNYDKHLETLSYYISQSQNLEETQTWLGSNHTKVTHMIDWVNGYER